MSRDNVSSEQNKASNEGKSNEKKGRWDEIKENLSRTYEKADKEGRFEQFTKHKLKIIPWEKTAEKVESHDENIIGDILSNL